MPNTSLHAWNLELDAAKELQKELSKQVIRTDQVADEVRHVAGVDMAINEENRMARAAVVLLSYPQLQILERHVYEEAVRMPYIPGLPSFREIPSILGAFAQLHEQPELVMVDGQG